MKNLLLAILCIDARLRVVLEPVIQACAQEGVILEPRLCSKPQAAAQCELELSHSWKSGSRRKHPTWSVKGAGACGFGKKYGLFCLDLLRRRLTQ